MRVPLAAGLPPDRKEEALNERYFGMHHDLQPKEIARRLNGTLAWEEPDAGMWIALIRFNRQLEARVDQQRRHLVTDAPLQNPTAEKPSPSQDIESQASQEFRQSSVGAAPLSAPVQKPKTQRPQS